MKPSRGRKIFSLNYFFASFFGALMIASAFAYYNYKFSEYKFIDFEKIVFYEKADIFRPKHETYTVLVYSSNRDDLQKTLPKLKKTTPILAIDMFQQDRSGEVGNVLHVSAGMNTLLAFIQRFNIYEVPTFFRLKKHGKYLYKQDSPIENLK